MYLKFLSKILEDNKFVYCIIFLLLKFGNILGFSFIILLIWLNCLLCNDCIIFVWFVSFLNRLIIFLVSSSIIDLFFFTKFIL